MIEGDKIFRLYANCVAVQGARRSIICDLQHWRAQFIPNGLFFILTEYSDKSVNEIKQSYNGNYDQTIDSYFHMLIEEDFGFWCDEPDRFPALDLSWERPEAVTNAIIDVDRNSIHDYGYIFSQLNNVGCQAVEIRAYDDLSMKELEDIAEASHGWLLRHLDLIVKYQPELTKDNLAKLCQQHQTISQITVHSSPEMSSVTIEPLPVVIRYSTHSVTPSSCGQISPGYFSLSLEHFAEAQNFNTCLNRKLGISANGEIKSCPAMQHSFGDIDTTPLTTIAKHPALIQIGRITKDQIAVCMDCEFRYICTDCRAYTCNSSDPYSKPAKCSYDPYTASWIKPTS
jgi:SPASM domain peptide maturase of grasp-with-spasm system